MLACGMLRPGPLIHEVLNICQEEFIMSLLMYGLCCLLHETWKYVSGYILYILLAYKGLCCGQQKSHLSCES